MYSQVKVGSLLDHNDPLEEDTIPKAIQTDSFATMDIEGPSQREEGEGEADFQKQDKNSTTSELTGETSGSLYVGEPSEFFIYLPLLRLGIEE